MKRIALSLVFAVMLFPMAALADQVNLGDNTCTDTGTITISPGPVVSGSPVSCQDDASFSSGQGNLGEDSEWSWNPTTGALSVSLVGGLDTLTGTVTWGFSGFVGSPFNLDLLAGSVLVSSVTGFHSEFKVGGNYPIDLTLQGCSLGEGRVSCNDVSSGEIPVPEPGSLTLLGTGLLAMAGFIRRKYFKV